MIRHRGKRSAMWVVLLGLLVTGCGGGSGDTASQPAESSKTRNLDPTVSSAEASQLSDGNNALAVELLGQLGGNSILSSYGASLSIGRLYLGSSGESRDQIAEVMHVGLAPGRLAASLNALDLTLARSIAPPTPPWEQSAAWGQARYGYLRTYLDGMAENFGLKPAYVNFAAGSTGQGTVSDWVHQLDGTHTDPINLDVPLNGATRLALADSAGADLAWDTPFDATLTRDEWFQLLDGRRVTRVPMMTISGALRRYQGDGFFAVDLPANGGLVSALFLFPDPGRFAAVSASLTPNLINEVASGLAPSPTELYLPKFFLTSELDLSPSLGSLGLSTAMAEDRADFSGIDGTRDLFLSGLRQGAGISVDEGGMGIASHTVASLDDAHPETWTNPTDPGYGGDPGPGSGSVIIIQPNPGGVTCLCPPLSFKPGRPFLFVIRDTGSGAILFLGRLVDPGGDRCEEDPSVPSAPAPLERKTSGRLVVGPQQAFAIGGDGSVWTWGFGGAGVSRIDAWENAVGVVQGRDGALMLRSDGTVLDASGFVLPGPELGGRVIGLAAGPSHQLFLFHGGTVAGRGDNSDGQLGTWESPPWDVLTSVVDLTDVVAVSAGANHSLALDAAGFVWAWGGNSDGQLGDGTLEGRWAPTQVPGLSGVVAVSTGDFYSLALRGDGTVWAWGRNTTRELGEGTTEGGLTPVQVKNIFGIVAVAAGADHSLALTADGSVWAWGRNNSGQVGNGTNADVPVPVQVEGVEDVIAVAAGDGYSAALTRSGAVWAWGAGRAAQLGDGASRGHQRPARLTQLRLMAKAVAAGNAQSLAVKVDGTVWAWGYAVPVNGSREPRSMPARVDGLSGVEAVATGLAHTVALDRNGAVWAWGANDRGQIGNGSTHALPTPTKVEGLADIVAVAAGSAHSLALARDGTIWGWGRNDWGQIGDGGAEDRLRPVRVGGLIGVVAIAVGAEANLALAKDGTLWAWGLDPSVWQVRRAPEAIRRLEDASAIGWGESHGLALLRNGNVQAWGANDFGQLGYPGPYRPTPARVRNLSHVAGVSAGPNFSAAVRQDGTVWTWGAQRAGQLGGALTPVLVRGLPPLSSVSAGFQHAVGLSKDGAVWAWGVNGSGEVGNGQIGNGIIGEWEASVAPIPVLGDEPFPFTLPSP